MNEKVLILIIGLIPIGWSIVTRKRFLAGIEGSAFILLLWVCLLVLGPDKVWGPGFLIPYSALGVVTSLITSTYYLRNEKPEDFEKRKKSVPQYYGVAILTMLVGVVTHLLGMQEMLGLVFAGALMLLFAFSRHMGIIWWSKRRRSDSLPKSVA